MAPKYWPSGSAFDSETRKQEQRRIRWTKKIHQPLLVKGFINNQFKEMNLLRSITLCFYMYYHMKNQVGTGLEASSVITQPCHMGKVIYMPQFPVKRNDCIYQVILTKGRKQISPNTALITQLCNCQLLYFLVFSLYIHICIYLCYFSSILQDCYKD